MRRKKQKAGRNKNREPILMMFDTTHIHIKKQKHSFCWNHSYTSTELYVTCYIIVWSTHTDNDMGTKLGRYFDEGNSTDIKSSLNKNNAFKWVVEITNENIYIYIKDETIIYSTKYGTTYLGFQICSIFSQFCLICV